MRRCGDALPWASVAVSATAQAERVRRNAVRPKSDAERAHFEMALSSHPRERSRPSRSDRRHPPATRRAACRQARRRRPIARRRRARPRRPPTPTIRFPMRSSGRLRAPRSESGRDPAPRRAANSTLVPAGNIGCVDSAGPSRLKRSASGSGPSTTHCGLPTSSTEAAIDSPATAMVDLSQIRWLPHRRPERVALAVARQQLERLDARIGVDRDRRRPAEGPGSRATSAARQRSPLPDSSDQLPSALSSCIVAPRSRRV